MNTPLQNSRGNAEERPQDGVRRLLIPAVLSLLSLTVLGGCSSSQEAPPKEAAVLVAPGTVDVNDPVVADVSEVPTEAPCAGCDVVLISVCSLRRDFVGAYGAQDVRTPNIDRIASTSARFDQAYSTSSFTLAGLSSILTGRFGSRTGVFRWGTGLGDDVPILPEILGFYGYATGAFSIDAASGFRPEYGIQRGFQRIKIISPPRDTPDGRHLDTALGPGGSSAIPAARWIGQQAQNRPLFAMYHSRTAHYPFVFTQAGPDEDPTGVLRALWDADKDHSKDEPAPGGEGGRFVTIPTTQKDQVHHVVARAGEAGTQALREAYRYAVEQMDIDVGIVLKAIEERGRLDKTIIVLLADHGESLNDHGEVLHGGSYFDGVVHIPMMISIPGIAQSTQDALVSQVDLVPTLLALVGADAPANIDGVSLLPLLRNEVSTVRQTTLIEGDPSMQEGHALSGAVISPPWVLMHQPTPCAGMVRLPPPSGQMAPHPGPPHEGGVPPHKGGAPPPMGPPDKQMGADGPTLHTCLFNTQQDPGQNQDLSSTHPDLVQQLMSRWTGYRSAVSGGSIPKELQLDPAFVELLQKTGYDFRTSP